MLSCSVACALLHRSPEGRLPSINFRMASFLDRVATNFLRRLLIRGDPLGDHPEDMGVAFNASETAVTATGRLLRLHFHSLSLPTDLATAADGE